MRNFLQKAYPVLSGFEFEKKAQEYCYYKKIVLRSIFFYLIEGDPSPQFKEKHEKGIILEIDEFRKEMTENYRHLA